MTSLADVDLYDDLPGHLARIHDRGRGHPFLFYRALGYVVTGVMPDANGRGRPDIYMCKRLPAESVDDTGRERFRAPGDDPTRAGRLDRPDS